MHSYFTGGSSLYNDFIAFTNFFLFFSPEGVRLIALQRTTDTLALFINDLVKPLIGFELPMLVLIRIAVLGVREIVWFILKTGWKWGKAILAIFIILIVVIMQALRIPPILTEHAISNMCDTSFL